MPNLLSRRKLLRNAMLATGGVVVGAAALNQVSPWIWRVSPGDDPNESYWSTIPRVRKAALTSDLSIDVAVLGGGFTGLSAAYFIRTFSPHRSVAVFEAEGCGAGASGRNGAMVLTMTADRYMSMSPDPQADRRLYDLTAANIGFLSQLSTQTGIDCEMERNGTLQTLITQDDVHAAQTYVQLAQRVGMPFEYWNAARVAAALGTGVYAGGFFDPAGGQLHPMKLVQVFEAAAQSAGAAIFENTPVNHIEEGAVHRLHTANGFTIKAGALVLATNAATPRLGFFRNAVLPIREYAAITRPLSEQELLEIGWRERLAFSDSRTQVFYLGLTADRRVHIGGGAPGYRFNDGTDSRDTGLHLRQLRHELVRIFPRLAGVPFEKVWDGVIDYSLDTAPSVGRTGRFGNIFHGLGYSGHGVNLTSVFGRIIADLAAGHDARWQSYPFVNARLPYVPNEPFRWLAAKSALAWYGLTERLQQ